MVRNRKMVAMMCALLVFTLLLAACSKEEPKNNDPAPGVNEPGTETPDNSGNGEEPAGNGEPEENQDPITLTVMNWGAGSADFFAPLYAEFTKKYPWITINAIGSGGGDTEGLSTLAAMQSSGNPPDLVWPQSIAKWTEGGNLVDLKPYIENDQVLPTLGMKEGFLQSWELDGQIFAVPWTDDPWPLVINKNLLEKYGLEMPANDWTYEDFRALAKAATDPVAGEYGLSYSGTFKISLPYLLSVANGNASKLVFMNETNTQSLANTPGVLADLQWLNDMFTADKVMMDAETFGATGYGEGGDFLAGKALFSIAQPLLMLDDMVDFEWDILPLPRGTSSQPTLSNTSPLAMLSASQNKDAAWKFIRFQYEYEASKWRIETLGFPAMMASAELDQLLASKYEGQNIDALKGSACCTGDSPVIFDYSGLHDGILVPAMVNYFNNGVDIAPMVPLIEDYNRRAAEHWDK